MTASAPLSSALVITRSLIPGANSAVRTGFMDVISAKAITDGRRPIQLAID